MSYISVITPYVLLFVSIAILVLNVVFVYIPTITIQQEVDMAANKIISVGNQVNDFLDQYTPKVEQLLEQTLALETKISNLLTTVLNQTGTLEPKLLNYSQNQFGIIFYGATRLNDKSVVTGCHKP